MTRLRAKLLPELVLAIVLIVAPFVLPRVGGSLDMLQRILNWGMLGLGFDLLYGAAGLLSFGQAAFYGTGGFVSAYLLINNVISSVWLALLIGTLMGGLFGLIIGWLAVRRIGIYFAMITLAFGQMAYFLENSPLSAYTGGENGFPGVPVPAIGSVPIQTGLPMYWLLAAFFFGSFLLARRILHSPFGAVLRAIKENTARVGWVGHSVPAYKLAVFVIAALFAGLAGGLLGVFQSYMPPDAFSLDTSGQLVVQTVIGGVGTLVGPTVGAAVWLYLRDNLQLIPGIGALWKLILGLIFVVLVVALKRGICGEIAHLFVRARPLAAATEIAEETEGLEPASLATLTLPMTAPLVMAHADAPALLAVELAKHYG
ncbi:MAG: branched-chain amino acid ABC transporter permease, partial [Acetobacteraceae bacterium]